MDVCHVIVVITVKTVLNIPVTSPTVLCNHIIYGNQIIVSMQGKNYICISKFVKSYTPTHTHTLALTHTHLQSFTLRYLHTHFNEVTSKCPEQLTFPTALEEQSKNAKIKHVRIPGRGSI